MADTFYNPQGNYYYQPNSSYTPPSTDTNVTSSYVPSTGSPASTAVPNSNIPAGQTNSPWVTANGQPSPQAPTPPAINPNPNDNSQVASNLNQAFNSIKDTPPPQNAGEAASAITSATNTAAQVPTFYKPDQHSPQVYNAQGQAVSHDQFIAQGGKADFSNVQNTAVPTKPMTPPSLIDQTLAADKGYQQLQKDYTDYQNTVNQGKTLIDSYNQIVKSSGLDAINTELINTQKVINGTEEDIRNEVTAAGGFATNSQVLALSDARNKTLVQNYNALVAQQKNVTDQINNMMTLTESDRNYALQVAQNKLNVDGQMLDYKNKFNQAAQEAYTNTIAAVGYDGLLKSLGNDTNAINLAEKTLGLQPGQLQSIAAQQQIKTNFNNQLDQLKLKEAQASITASNASAGASAASANKSRVETALLSSNNQAATSASSDIANLQTQLKQGGNIQGNGTISSSDYKIAKQKFVNTYPGGFTDVNGTKISAKDYFDEQMFSYVDTNQNKSGTPGYYKDVYGIGQ